MPVASAWDAGGFRLELLLHHAGFGRAFLLDGHGLGFLAPGFGHGLLLKHVGLGRAVLLQGIGLGFGAAGFGHRLLFDHVGLGESQGRFLGRDPFGQELLGGGFLFRSVAGGLGGDHLLLGVELRGVAAGLGRLDLLDQRLLGLLFRGGDGHLLGSLRGGDLVGVLDLLFLFDHGPFDHHALADHVLDGLLFHLDRLVLLDVGQGDDPLPLGDLQQAVLLDPFGFHLVGTFLVALGHDDLAVLVFLGDGDVFLGGDPGAFAFESLLLLDFAGFGPLAGGHRVDLALLLFFGLGLLALEFQDRLPGLDVLLLDDLFLLAGDLIGQDGLLGRLVGNFLDAFGVEDVLRVEFLDRRLFQVVDGRVVQVVAVEIAADDLEDLLLERFPGGIQVDEIELLTDRFQRLGEFGVEPTPRRIWRRTAPGVSAVRRPGPRRPFGPPSARRTWCCSPARKRPL